ncbi:MAG: hypothetical protein IJ188_07780 [Clostridia bacterium]|nr:hypothetical protein [Clostridia bacterium]
MVMAGGAKAPPANGLSNSQNGLKKNQIQQHMTMDAAMDYMDIAIDERPRYVALLREAKTEYQAR